MEMPSVSNVALPSSISAGRGCRSPLPRSTGGSPGSPAASCGPPFSSGGAPGGLQGLHSPCTLLPLLPVPVPGRAGSSALGTNCRHRGLQDAVLLNMLVHHRPPGARSPPCGVGEWPLASTASTLLEQRVQHTAVEEQAQRRARHKALVAPVGCFQLRGSRALLSCCYF